jgi:hypothetical protein
MNRKERRMAASQGLITSQVREELDAGWQLLQMARRAAELAEFEQAREAVGYARQVFERHVKAVKSSNGLAQCGLMDGYLLWRFGDLLSSADALKRALNSFRKLGDEANEAACEY